ncbi:MAG: hypothetical protein L0177_04875 [Chloroflexi bacterium]|nr:hypothetical protein [Chloroflexota bacterium]
MRRYNDLRALSWRASDFGLSLSSYTYFEAQAMDIIKVPTKLVWETDLDERAALKRRADI